MTINDHKYQIHWTLHWHWTAAIFYLELRPNAGKFSQSLVESAYSFTFKKLAVALSTRRRPKWRLSL